MKMLIHFVIVLFISLPVFSQTRIGGGDSVEESRDHKKVDKDFNHYLRAFKKLDQQFARAITQATRKCSSKEARTKNFMDAIIKLSLMDASTKQPLTPPRDCESCRTSVSCILGQDKVVKTTDEILKMNGFRDYLMKEYTIDATTADSVLKSLKDKTHRDPKSDNVPH